MRRCLTRHDIALSPLERIYIQWLVNDIYRLGERFSIRQVISQKPSVLSSHWYNQESLRTSHVGHVHGIMKSSTLFPLLALISSALGAPNAGLHLDIRSLDECEAVTAIISLLSQYKAPATSFCSSYLSIPVQTATLTNVLLSTKR